jgi:hypothetical protein
MLRSMSPYLIVGLAISALAGWGYGGGDVSVLGSYGALALAIAVAVLGYMRWEQGEHDQRSPRR